jgi:hypothetical protein
MLQRKYAVILIISILLCESTPLSQAAKDQKKNVWSLAETKIFVIKSSEQAYLTPNDWHLLYSHESGNKKGIIDLSTGTIHYETKVDIPHPYIPNERLTWQHTETVNYNPIPPELKPGETINSEISLTLTSGKFESQFLDAWYSWDNPRSIGNYASVRPMINKDKSFDSDTLSFVVPELSDEELIFTLYNGGGGFNVHWIYRAEIQKTPVIFIPGVGGSVLTAPTSLLAKERWPIAYLGGRSDLELDKNGVSSTKIEAPDIIRYVEVMGFGRTDIYGSFIETMENWRYKEEYNLFVFPYDWRLSN